jgi:hypothetical protein
MWSVIYSVARAGISGGLVRVYRNFLKDFVQEGCGPA